MPSQDLLEKLFEVERMAEALVGEAREEAGRRVDAAKTRAQRSYAETYENALKEATASRETAQAAVDAEYRRVLDDYRTRLESTRIDRAAFDAACEGFIAEIA